MARKPQPGKSLAEVNPDLAKEWHPAKNGSLTPHDVVAISYKKVWWKCNRGDDHEWSTSVGHRSRGTKCPICAGQKVVLSNCLATLNPPLAKEWHPTKNGDLTPLDLTIRSNKRVWWKCDKGDDHEWQATVNTRDNGRGCPICSNRFAVSSNCLATLNPKLAKEWHPTKNGGLTPYNVVPLSIKKVWWKCNKGDDHEWKATIAPRDKGVGCPICRGLKVVPSNSLATINPNLAVEWHPTKNGLLTPQDFTISSGKKVWWKCDKGEDHEWIASVASRSNGSGCSVCNGKKAVLSNCLATLNPKLAKEWHPTKNGKLTPQDVTINSNKRVWWKCDKGDDHEWVSSISNRAKGNDCSVCAGKTAVNSNCLATLNPELAKEWHPTKNGKLSPFEVSESSNKIIWWKCEKGIDHEWRTSVGHRSNGKGCPYCTLTPQSKQELTITFELIQFFKIDPKGFKTRVNGKLWTIDIYIPELSLGIEFDGKYWHKDKYELDKLKTEKLESEGFKIMRIREVPLKAITNIDIISKTPFNAKSVTDDVLKHILKAFPIDKKRVKRIEKYLTKKTIQNEKGLDDYIELILKMKAEKKANHS